VVELLTIGAMQVQLPFLSFIKCLVIVRTGVSMTIPEGAVREDESVDVYLAVLRDDKDRPKLTGFFFLYKFSFHPFPPLHKNTLFLQAGGAMAVTENGVLSSLSFQHRLYEILLKAEVVFRCPKHDVCTQF